MSEPNDDRIRWLVLTKTVADAWNQGVLPGDDAECNLWARGMIKARATEVEQLRARVAEQRAALLRIAFQEDCSSLSATPSKWPSTIAYLALGGRIQAGKRIDDRAALSASPSPQDNSEDRARHRAALDSYIDVPEAEREVIEATAGARPVIEKYVREDQPNVRLRFVLDRLDNLAKLRE